MSCSRASRTPLESLMLRQRPLLSSPRCLSVALGFSLLAVACDNVGRAFDPNVDPGGSTGETGISNVQVVAAGGSVRDGRPQVRAAYPEGAGWPRTVPIVVEFSESVNEATLEPTSPAGFDGRIGVRVQGSTELLPATYDWLVGGRLLVLRPVGGLQPDPALFYEVVLFPDARDVDGVRFQVTGDEQVLSEFQVNQDETIQDGRILAIYPRDNFDALERESPFVVVFDRPANAASLQPSELLLAPDGGAAIDLTVLPALPVSAATGGPDLRAVQLVPQVALTASTSYRFTVTENITFGASGNLDFNGRTPFSVFDTIAPSRPLRVELGNPSAGYDNKINLANFAAVQLQVEVGADALVGDVVDVRIYGGDAATEASFDLTYVERSVTLTAAGAQSFAVDFTGDLGTIGDTTFDDGAVTFAAQLRRSGEASGFVHHPAGASPVVDLSPPTLLQAGPPGNGTDVYTDHEQLLIYGQASEELAAADYAATLTTPTAGMFGASGDGTFLTEPLLLGRQTAPVPYNTVLTDTAGNASASITGNIVQRGLLTGALAGTLTVEAYDEVSLAPIEGATVVVEGLTPALTGADGRVAFAVAGSSHTVTIVRAGYDLITVAGTQAAFVSLPLRPIGGGTATLRVAVGFDAAAGQTALVGSTALAAGDVLAVATPSTAPTVAPSTTVLANRPQVVTAFAGTFEPTAAPTFAFQGCTLLGPTLSGTTAPIAPVADGGEVDVLLPLIVAPAPTVGGLIGVNSEDFSAATGLDLAGLVAGGPRCRVTTSLAGFRGQLLMGVGFATATGGGAYDVDVNYSLQALAGLAPLSPSSWLVTEAEDGAGRISRVRAFLNAAAGSVLASVGAPAIPSIATPGAAAASPTVVFDDVLDASLVAGGAGVAISDVTAIDGSGRRWTVLVPDRDVAGGTESLTFPDLGAIVGLASGTWNVVVESRLFLTLGLATVDDFVLLERFRQEVNYSRSTAVVFDVL